MAEKYVNLCVGYDLGNDYSQISCYNERREEVDSICLPGKAAADEIPTKLAFNIRTKEWAFGQDALACTDYPWILLSDFVSDYDVQPKLNVSGQSFDKKELVYRFVKMSLELIKRYYPHGKVTWLTFTGAAVSKQLLQDLLEIGKTMEMSPEIVKVQNHLASYENYALCQPKELWSQDIGLFEYDDNGMNYYHLTVNRRRTPMVVSADKLELSAYFSGEDYKTLPAPELDKRFMSVVRQVMCNKNVCTVYLVGPGFMGGWMNMSLKALCAGRKAFMGQNLYSKGACYNSVLEATGTKNKVFIALSGEMVPVSLYLHVTRGKETIRYELVKAGCDWYSVDISVRFILDQTDTVVLHVVDFVTNKEKIIPFRLENLPDRPNRTTRVSMGVTFESDRICQITLEDKGFGALYKTSKKAWKMRINVVEYQSPESFEESGRLIYSKDPVRQVPYYFNVSGVKVYSIEELCYYIYENIYSINAQTFSEDLFYWMENDLDEVTLSRGLRHLAKNEASVKDLVRYLMNFVDYYSAEESEYLMQIMEALANQNPTESKKVEADNYFRYCRYMEAIRVYNDVIYDMEHGAAEEVSREFKGNTWHNLGCAYTRVMNYKAALNCFKKAWRLNQNQDSLKSCLWAAQILQDEENFYEIVSNSTLDESEIASILEEYDRIEADASGERNETLKKLKAALEEVSAEDFDDFADSYVNELKDWYRG